MDIVYIVVANLDLALPVYVICRVRLPVGTSSCQLERIPTSTVRSLEPRVNYGRCQGFRLLRGGSLVANKKQELIER